MYVSCSYAPPDEITPQMPGAPKRITCIDDNGVEWWLAEDSEVGDYLRFKDDGGEITPYAAAKPAPDEPPA